MESENIRLSVIIPAFNEEKRLPRTLAHVVAYLEKQDFYSEIIVVDDGSTDEGYDRIKSLPGVTILRHRHNLGKGEALRTGMLKAAELADWAVCLDADGQHDPDDIAHLISAIPQGSRPIVLGKRVIGMENAPWTSRFGRRFSNFWVWVSGGVRLADSQSGFRIYPLPEVLSLGVHAGRYQFEIEVLAKAAWQAMPILEVPVKVSYAPGACRISHFDPWKDFLRNSQTFCRLIVRRVFTPRLWRVSSRF